jgi:antitoxin component YwqK of YwqJK toxin-antitoxin module
MVSFSLQHHIKMNMKRLILLASGIWMILAAFFACQSPSAPKERLLYYKDSKAVLRRYFIINEKIEGVMTEYFEDGKIKLERFFKNGVEEGRTALYYPDGKIREIQRYTNGQRQGGDTLFFQDGKPQLILQFKDNKKNGPLQKWSPEGTLSFEAIYENDTLKTVTKAPNVLEKAAASK